jgi:hypothetical protein
MVVMDADKGTVLGTAEIGKGSDGCVFDPGTSLAYSSNGEGTITVVRESDPGKFTAVSTIPTQPGARTIALDSQTHRLYLSCATMAPDAGGQPQGRGRRNFVPGSFAILVVGD